MSAYREATFIEALSGKDFVDVSFGKGFRSSYARVLHALSDGGGVVVFRDGSQMRLNDLEFAEARQRSYLPVIAIRYSVDISRG